MIRQHHIPTSTPTFHLEDNTPYYENASYSWSDKSVRYMNTVSANARDHYLYMQECGYFQTSPDYYTERSGLPSYLILYTLSGQGQLLYARNTYQLNPGSCFYIDCQLSHRYEPSDQLPKEPAKSSEASMFSMPVCMPASISPDTDKSVKTQKNWEFLWLHFNGISARGYYHDFSALGEPVLQIQDTFLVETTLRRILSLYQRKNISSEVLTSSLITNLLTELIIQKLTASQKLFRLPDSIHEATAFIQAHFTEELRLDQIAAFTNVSKYHLSREFSRYMGISINQYIINCKMQYAKELLRESSLSIDAIADQIGIGHTSHFIALFKAREGTTPLEYRKLWRTQS